MEHVQHKLVFIVEDNDMYSLMLDYMLSKESSCHFVSFKTGEECISNLSMNPDLIILDYGLPGLNGLETFKEIKKENPEIPVVVLTENHDVHIAQQFMHEGGVYEYLLKEKDSVKQISEIIDKLLINSREDKGFIKKEEKKKKKKILRILVGVISFTTLVMLAFWYMQRCT
ncbi:MAG: response regulator [Bacteroidota bacterium]